MKSVSRTSGMKVIGILTHDKKTDLGPPQWIISEHWKYVNSRSLISSSLTPCLIRDTDDAQKSILGPSLKNVTKKVQFTAPVPVLKLLFSICSSGCWQVKIARLCSMETRAIHLVLQRRRGGYY